MAAPERQLACLHMMGVCALDVGRAADAVAHLEQALSLPELPSELRLPLRYDLGRAYAATRDVERARAAFEEVAAADPGFRDVAQELARLAAPPPLEIAEHAEPAAEAYESLDTLVSEGAGPAATPRYESFDDLFGDEADEAPEALPDAPPGPELELAVDESPSLAPAEPAPDPEPERALEPERAASPDVPAAPEPVAQRRRRKISFV